ncbi:hypothetical protein DT210_14715 [Salmonella enterica subsp. enterica]|nr:hypothetical protein [Salmonella enterica subsp. enterica serovar Typhimurium]EBY0151616.1 hypothetical protein [Salmonella enterica subsp. enterica serovar Typhimurium]EBY2510479.1 hypothetical protein [Salmonella enterica subsp. enterica serovar Typhimurium]MJX96572.1 hypothetical protein [Salmonella enterica subsp. enterica serovar Typhimurium]
MNTQNVKVKTATKESTKRWGKKMARIIDRGHYNLACAQEAHTHYGDKFTRTDTCWYFIRGVLTAIFNKSRAAS